MVVNGGGSGYWNRPSIAQSPIGGTRPSTSWPAGFTVQQSGTGCHQNSSSVSPASDLPARAIALSVSTRNAVVRSLGTASTVMHHPGRLGFPSLEAAHPSSSSWRSGHQSERGAPRPLHG